MKTNNNQTGRAVLVGWMKFGKPMNALKTRPYEDFKYHTQDDDHEQLEADGYEPVFVVQPYGDVKYMDINEFRDEGFLQEANRQFFHPLGLALEVTQEANGMRFLSGVWDCRDDPEGVAFFIENEEELAKMKIKAQKVKNERQCHIKARRKLLGSVEQRFRADPHGTLQDG